MVHGDAGRLNALIDQLCSERGIEARLENDGFHLSYYKDVAQDFVA